jgi:hypothetical protein
MYLPWCLCSKNEVISSLMVRRFLAGRLPIQYCFDNITAGRRIPTSKVQGSPLPWDTLRTSASRAGPAPFGPNFFCPVYTHAMYRTVRQMNRRLSEHVMDRRRNSVQALLT